MKRYFTLIFLTGVFSLCGDTQSYTHEQPAVTITEEDFRLLVKRREEGLAGIHCNVDPSPVIPAGEDAVFNWSQLPEEKIEQLVLKQEEMFRQGKITLIVMAGGEATRFGGPKTFVSVSEDLGEFLEIKAANLNWMRQTYGAQVPLYLLSSEKRLAECQTALKERNYYGLKAEDFRWFVQGTVDTFIPSDEELKTQFGGEELQKHRSFAQNLRQANPDGIYRFKGERRKVPEGHFDAIASFIISGLFSEALAKGIEFVSVVNIDNLQALLKNDGMIAFLAEQKVDFGFLLAEKNLSYSIYEEGSGKLILPKLIVRFRDGVLSFDGIHEFLLEAEKENYLYRLNQELKLIEVFDRATGQPVKIATRVKAESGGTLVQPVCPQGNPVGKPILKEGFELPSHFPHARAPFFNTNTVVINLPSLLKFLEVTQKELAVMTFQERSQLVHEKMIAQLKTYFEFKYHEVEGEYPDLGVIKGGKTKILVSQATRIMLQAAHLKGAFSGYLFAPRSSVFAPVKEPEDKHPTAHKCCEAIKKYTIFPSN